MQTTEHVNGNVGKTSAPVTVLPVSKIHVDSSWNARSGNWAEASGGDFGSEFPDLVTSIREKGQDTPILVRATGKGGKYELIAGFRRLAAIQAIAAEGGTVPNIPEFTASDPHVRVEVRKLSDVEARALNLRENTARDELRAADIAWGVAELDRLGLSQAQIASELGRTQSYVSLLLGIVKKAPKQAKRWREETASTLTLKEMKDVSDAEGDAAKDEMFEKYRSGKGAQKEKAEKGTAWLQRVFKQVDAMGHMIGTLQRVNFLPFKEELEFDADSIRSVVDYKEDCTRKQEDKIVEVAQKAYLAALGAPADEEAAE